LGLLEVENLRTVFRTEDGPVTAVNGLSFKLDAGETLGIVGESGSGKSVTALSIMRLLGRTATVTADRVYFGGESLLEKSEAEMRRIRGYKIAMIFQDPMTSLNPVLTIGEQISEAVRLHLGLGKREARDRAVEMLKKVRIPLPEKRLGDYPHQFSGGMRQRVMIAMALSCNPQLLIADEPTTALDVTIQAQILELLGELRAKFGLAMLFISHDLAVVSQVADRVAVMYAGCLAELGTKHDIFQAAAHPYTRGLLQAVPDLTTDRDRPLETIDGTVPPLHAMPPGCAFEPRCDFRVAACAEQLPPLVEVSVGHWARCPVVNS
jgi:oligopeptide/dipeptide ABC transporter ATP-binding protein